MLYRTLAVLCLVLGSHVAPAALAKEPNLKQPSFDSAGVPIHYVVTGREDGEPVVLIHGFAGNIDAQWSQIIPALKNDYKIIGIDCRGHGGSGKPHEPEKYGLEMVQDVVRLLDHLKIDRAHVVGYSMGAGIALRFAVLYPERVRTVTLGGSSGINRDQKALIEAVADSLETGRGIGPVIIALTPKDRPPPTPETIKIMDGLLAASNDVQALAAVARGTGGKNVDLPSDEQIANLPMPTLAIIGARDPLRPGVDELKKLHPATEVVIIDGADHMTAFTRAEFIDTLRKFLAEHRQRAPM